VLRRPRPIYAEALDRPCSFEHVSCFETFFKLINILVAVAVNSRPRIWSNSWVWVRAGISLHNWKPFEAMLIHASSSITVESF